MYLALYRKYRPQTFDDVISQQQITTTLSNEVSTGRIAHAYLFTGSRGTGKTTCARILAKAINCLHSDHGQPCGGCSNCIGIDNGSILDVTEMDAASNRGIDSIRELREEANYTPVTCPYRVYIIDEVHMLSGDAFNALLKIMEEPPSHVVFILATTEPHKIPMTILSRCQRFDFRRIQPADIAQRLLDVAEAEGFTLEEPAAALIARLADGGMRDALSLLDQCVAYADVIDESVVSAASGLAGRAYLEQFHQAVVAQDAAKALGLLDELDQKSKDLERLCEELIQFYRNLMVVKTTPDASAIIPVASEELEQLKGSAEALSLPQILYWLSAFQETFERLSRCSNKRLEIEMLFVRLCSPQLDSRLDGILARLERLEQQLANRSGNAAGPPPQQMVNPDASTEMASSVVPVAEQQESVPLQDAPADLESLIIPEQPEPSVPKSVGPQPLTCWDEVMRDLSEETPMLAGILRGSTALIAGDRLLLQSPNSVFKDTILNKKDLLDAAILRHTGQKYRLMVKTALQKEENKELAQLLDNARKSGIEIEEE